MLKLDLEDHDLIVPTAELVYWGTILFLLEVADSKNIEWSRFDDLEFNKSNFHLYTFERMTYFGE